MPAVVRIGDELDTGHGCDSTTTLATQGPQSTVYANNILVAVPGAVTVSHLIPAGDPPCVSHTANLNAGSSTVFVQGRPIGRVGDSADAGKMTKGSPNVFAGG